MDFEVIDRTGKHGGIIVRQTDYIPDRDGSKNPRQRAFRPAEWLMEQIYDLDPHPIGDLIDGIDPANEANDIKSCLPSYTDESCGKPTLKQPQHDYLLDHDGYYIFVLVEPAGIREWEIIEWERKSADDVHDEAGIDQRTWIEDDDREYMQIPYDKVLDYQVTRSTTST